MMGRLRWCTVVLVFGLTSCLDAKPLLFRDRNLVVGDTPAVSDTEVLRYYNGYDYDTVAPLSVPECFALLNAQFPDWVSPYLSGEYVDNSTTVADDFAQFFLQFASTNETRGCFITDAQLQEITNNTAVELPTVALYADLTWAVALEKQTLSNLMALDLWTPNLTQFGYFTSLQELLDRPEVSNEITNGRFLAADRDSQAGLYVPGALADSEYGSTSPYAADNAPVMNNSVGLLYPRTYMMLYYRHDVFNSSGLAVPNTWDELLVLAEALQGSNFTGADPTTGGYGFCFDLGEMCKSNFFLMAIAASFIQYNGISQGLWMDPDTLESLLGPNAAMMEAFRIFKRLKELSPPESNTTCMAWNAEFDKGNCAMTLEWDVTMHFMRRELSPVKGRLGVALAPGTTKVWMRSNDSLVACTPALCPYATEGRTAAAASRRRNTLAVGSWINRAPFSTLASFDTLTIGYYSANNDLVCQVRKFLNVYTLPFPSFLVNRQLVFDDALADLPDPPSGPRLLLQGSTARAWRPRVLLDSTPQAWNLTFFTYTNMNEDDCVSYFDAVWQARWHPNPATDIAVSSAYLYRVAVEEAIHNITALEQDPSTVLPSLAARFPIIREYENDSTTYEHANAYRRTVGIATNQPLPAPPSPPPAPAAGENSYIAIAIAVPVAVVGCALLAALTGLALYRRHLNQNVLGKVVAPGISPDTTLLCTDIQNSTLLWESLDAAIMDVAVSTHHEVLRRSMHKRSGYLSAMEGDSFIIAFHTAKSAVLFAIEAQMALLKAEWSPELLAAPDCQPVWLSRRGGAFGLKALSNGGPSNSSLSVTDTTRRLLLDASRSLFRMRQLSRSASATLSSGIDLGADLAVADWSRTLGLRRAAHDLARYRGPSNQPLASGLSDVAAAEAAGEADDATAFLESEGTLVPAPTPATKPSGGIGGAFTKLLAQSLSLSRSGGSGTQQQQQGNGALGRQVEFGVVQASGPSQGYSAVRTARRSSNNGTISSVNGYIAGGNAIANLPAGWWTTRSNREAVVRKGTELEEASTCAMAARTRSTTHTPHPVAQPYVSAPIHHDGIDLGMDYGGGREPSDVTIGLAQLAASHSRPKSFSRFHGSNVPVPPPPLSTPEHSRLDVAAEDPSSGDSLAAGNDVEEATGGLGAVVGVGLAHNASADSSAIRAELDSSRLDLNRVTPGAMAAMESRDRMSAASLAPHAAPCTWQQLMLELFDVQAGLWTGSSLTEPRRGQVLVFNGIRVRMGMHSGVHNSDEIVFNQAAGNVQYSGEPLESAKAVSTAAGGGMVLLSGQTYRRILPKGVQHATLLLYAGDYHLEDVRRQWVIYQAAAMALPQRLALSDPVKCIATLQLGTPSAPVGLVTIVFMYVVGASTLLAEVPDEARPALARFHTVVTEVLLLWGGYLVEAVDGLILAAFSNAASAASWGLACQEQMLVQDWTPELLAHEYCEEVFVVQGDKSPVAMPPPRHASKTWKDEKGTSSLLAGEAQMSADSEPQVVVHTLRRRILMRGLRLKVGLDMGRPTPDIHPGSGRMQYRGRVMNRAARIASKASAGHVVCSGAAWGDIQEEPSPMPAASALGPLVASSMGIFNLKGINEPLELFHCVHSGSVGLSPK